MERDHLPNQSERTTGSQQESPPVPHDGKLLVKLKYRGMEEDRLKDPKEKDGRPVSPDCFMEFSSDNSLGGHRRIHLLRNNGKELAATPPPQSVDTDGRLPSWPVKGKGRRKKTVAATRWSKSSELTSLEEERLRGAVSCLLTLVNLDPVELSDLMNKRSREETSSGVEERDHGSVSKKPRTEETDHHVSNACTALENERDESSKECKYGSEDGSNAQDVSFSHNESADGKTTLDLKSHESASENEKDESRKEYNYSSKEGFDGQNAQDVSSSNNESAEGETMLDLKSHEMRNPVMLSNLTALESPLDADKSEGNEENNGCKTSSEDGSGSRNTRQVHYRFSDTANGMLRIKKDTKKETEKLNTKGNCGPNKYRCSTCDKCFPTPQALGGHTSSHKKAQISTVNAVDKEDEQKHQASPIRQQAEETKDSEVALSSKLVEQNSYKCKICDKAFPTGQALGGHQRLHYKGLAKKPPTSKVTSPGDAEASIQPCSNREMKDKNAYSFFRRRADDPCRYIFRPSPEVHNKV
ncbi:hypothetical protein RJ639_045625 [Escallonia herrerae]|uniref:C2H2-type domain-containing protein n=1 Tax=Escallonia herrerae TaxID=1293975 RepID=A0AA89B4A2_9ASTE|nr:hypothetical protein RJ639_045625 [Escallonia herrerae]